MCSALESRNVAVRTNPDAGLRSSGAGVRPADGGSRAECSAQKLNPAAAKLVRHELDPPHSVRQVAKHSASSGPISRTEEPRLRSCVVQTTTVSWTACRPTASRRRSPKIKAADAVGTTPLSKWGSFVHFSACRPRPSSRSAPLASRRLAACVPASAPALAAIQCRRAQPQGDAPYGSQEVGHEDRLPRLQVR